MDLCVFPSDADNVDVWKKVSWGDNGGGGWYESHGVQVALEKRMSVRVRKRGDLRALERMSSLIPRGHLGPEGSAALQPGQSERGGLLAAHTEWLSSWAAVHSPGTTSSPKLMKWFGSHQHFHYFYKKFFFVTPFVVLFFLKPAGYVTWIKSAWFHYNCAVRKTQDIGTMFICFC